MITERKNGLDILKIISIFLIILFHLSLYGIEKNDLATQTSFSTFFLGTDKILTGLFFFISFYFLADNRHFKLIKVIKFFIQMVVFSLILGLLNLLINDIKPTFLFFLNIIFPVFPIIWWFISTYLVAYLLAPLVNYLISKTNIYIHLSIMIISFILWIIFPILKVLSSDYTLVFRIIFLYFLAYFTRKYLKDFKINFFIGILSFIGIYLISFLIYYLITKDTYYHFQKILVANNPLQIILMLALFFAFKDLNIKNNKAIAFINQSGLTIYMFHDYPFINDIFWNKLFNIELANNLFYILGFALLVYLAGFICYIIYRYTIALALEKPLNLLNQKHLYKIDNFFNRGI